MSQTSFAMVMLAMAAGAALVLALVGIPADDLDQMTGWIRGNGRGSQAIVIAEFNPSVVPAGQPVGHAFNMHFENNAIEMLDRTNLKMSMGDVAQWWFFPTR